MKYKKPTSLRTVATVALVVATGLLVSKAALSPATRTQQTAQPTDGSAGQAAARQVSQHVGSVSDGQAADTTMPSKVLPGHTQKRYYLLSDPNDPYYSSSWYLPAVNVATAWSVTTGSTSVVVADIDTGFALSHQDLAAHWYYNPGENGGGKDTNGTDDDNNRYVDDYRGWDFVNNDNNPQAGATNPSGQGTTHGTETAGLIGAVGNNGVGTTAIAQNVSIMPLQVIDDNGNGYSDDVASAIDYAVANGANVINMSLGTSGNDPIVEAAVDNAVAHNVVVVAAAGNCGIAGSDGPCSGQPTGYITFPASYNKVIAVGATDSSGARANFSSYGERLDVVAPGSGSIVSPTWTNGNGTSAYASTLYGTSFASPIVASSVALIKAIRPETSVDDVRALIMASTGKLSAMSGAVYTTSLGHGLLNVGKSVTVANDLNTSGEVSPELLQAGGPSSEGTYGASDTLGSGCITSQDVWCTVWLRNNDSNYERFLPYIKAGSNGQVGWSFTSAALNHGLWAVRARDGGMVSDTPYYLFRK